MRFQSSGRILALKHNLPDQKDTFLILFGMGLAAALTLKDTPILHAASVLTRNGAVLVLGPSGSGKSTLTGLMAGAGCAFLCDDMAALKFESGGIGVHPGHPWLKVNPGLAAHLGLAAKNLVPVFVSEPEYPDCWVDSQLLAGGFCNCPVPLHKVYALNGRDRRIEMPVIRTLSPADGCLMLMENLYGRKWLANPQESSLRTCAGIASNIPVRRVCMPQGLEHMPKAANFIMADAEAL